ALCHALAGLQLVVAAPLRRVGLRRQPLDVVAALPGPLRRRRLPCSVMAREADGVGGGVVRRAVGGAAEEEEEKDGSSHGYLHLGR
ncbi:hypothetical protein DKP78_21225, partial [Enterococcus faecium]